MEASGEAATSPTEGDVRRPPYAGCVVCRSRKVRCDKERPQCGNCARLGVTCPGYETGKKTTSRSQMLESTQNIFKAAGVEKRRIGSCDECRTSKSRCSRTKPACSRCILRGLECRYRVQITQDPADSIDAEVSPLSEPSRGIDSPCSSLGAEVDQLFSDALPDEALRSRLFNIYFEQVHPLRCISFIHKPSFMQALHRSSLIQDYGEPLLQVMCALAARSLLNETDQTRFSNDARTAMKPGEAWADRARKEVLAEIHVPTIQHIMTLLLLCEYGFRTDQHSLIFFLSGCVYRALRLLGLDVSHQLPNPLEPSEITQLEVEKRLIWACWTVDILISSGIDKNSSWRKDIPEVPLPCTNQDFLAQTISPISHSLHEADVLESLEFLSNLDLPALTMVLVRVRSNVLRLIRTTPDANCPIWHSSSPFMKIIAQLETFHRLLPDKFQLGDLNIYLLKDQHNLAAVVSLHLFYHAAAFDLTRISLAGFNFPLASALRDAPEGFRSQCQDRCRFHANEVSNIIRTVAQHGRVAFSDPFCADAAMESGKIQIVHSATVANDLQTRETTLRNLQTNLELLRLLRVGKDGEGLHIRGILSLCKVFGYGNFAEQWIGTRLSPTNAEVTGSADIHHLSSISSFRLARSEVQAHSDTTSPQTVSSIDIQGSTHSGLTTSGQPPIYAAASARNHGLEAYGVSEMAHPYSQPEQSINNIGQVGTSLVDHGLLPAPDVVQPMMEEYARTADSMADLLCWEMSELADIPAWVNFDWMNQPDGQNDNLD